MGRIYDAWNKEPKRTFSFFRQAINYMRLKSTDTARQYYTIYLLAHTYGKSGDNASMLVMLEQLFNTIRKEPKAALYKMPFTSEMALAAAEAGGFELARRILQLTPREWIANDATTHNYLDHYYVTRALMEVHAGRHQTLYMDSVKQAYEAESKITEKIYDAAQLLKLYELIADYKNAYRFQKKIDSLQETLVTPEGQDLFTALLQSELSSRSRQNLYQAHIRTTRTAAQWILSVLVVVISVLSFYLYTRNRKYKGQSKLLVHTNQVLDEKIEQVRLLNKEIEHRVKNNLYTIQSLLQLQSRQTENEEVAASLQIAQMRVECMALLHNMLLRGHGHLSFKAYAETLIKEIVSSYATEKEINFTLDVEDSPLPETFYVPLSLILNEWVTNSVKYAQTDDRILRLFLSVKKENDGPILIGYYDNGVLPQKPAVPQEGLGSQIIRMLSRQMRATLIQKPLFHYKITLPS